MLYWIYSFDPCNRLSLSKKKMKHREGKWLAHSHTAIMLQTQYLNPGNLISEPEGLTITLHCLFLNMSQDFCKESVSPPWRPNILSQWLPQGILRQYRLLATQTRVLQFLMDIPALASSAVTGWCCRDLSEKSCWIDGSYLLYPRANQIMKILFYTPRRSTQ